MNLLKLFFHESPGRTVTMLMLAIGAGVCGGMIVLLLILAVRDIAAGEVYWRYALALPLVGAFFVLTKHVSEQQASWLGEAVWERLTLQSVAWLRQRECIEIEALDRAEVTLTLTKIQMIAGAAMKSVTILQYLLTILVCWLSIFAQSAGAGLIILCAILGAVSIQNLIRGMSQTLLHEEHHQEAALFAVFTHLLSGFKALKIFPAASTALFQNVLHPLSDKVADMRARLMFYHNESPLLSMTIMYLMLGSYIFVFSVRRGDAIMMTAIVISLFILKIINGITIVFPGVLQGIAALEQLKRIFPDDPVKHPRDVPYSPLIKDFQTLSFHEVRFHYPLSSDETAFYVGPVNLTFRAGEILFIRGGNGSGKTTLLKLLTGLYTPDAGEIRIDGQRVPPQILRALYAAVFTDFHLFEALYGLETPDEALINAWLARMELADSASYANGRFRTLALSAGQRKRLALIAALLEDKPIYVFDEWAADQAPEFRRVFYEELLPALQAQGKTLFVVTHDDRYEHFADRILTMEYGRIATDCQIEKAQAAVFAAPQMPPRTAPSCPTTTPPEPTPRMRPQVYLRSLLTRLSSIPFMALFIRAILPGSAEVAVPLFLVWSAYGITGISQEQSLLIFLLMIIIYTISFQRLNLYLSYTLQHKIAALRTTIMERVRRLDVRSFEQLDSEAVYMTLTKDLQAVSEIGHTVTALFRVTARACATLLTIALISVAGLIFSLSMVCGVGLLYVYNQYAMVQIITQTRRHEQRLLTALKHLLDGFKELKLNERKQDDFFQETFLTQCAQCRQLELARDRVLNLNTTLVYGLWMVLLIGSVLIVPRLVPLSEFRLFAMMTLILLMPVNQMIEAWPLLILAILSLQRLFKVEDTLACLNQEPAEALMAIGDRPAFHELRYIGISFHYASVEQQAFRVGPLTLELHPGEILFIIGGNGSGKTTAIKLLMGLYLPDAGQILLNGQAITPSEHRHLFAPVFNDFHLFDRLYGMIDIDENPVNALLAQMQIDQKVQYTDGRFTTLDLSTGQKKRLALVCAMLEDRPIYVFDEWAAEQDPQFRRYFYETLLSSFAAEGKTVIVVTHDDRYFHVADRVLKMEYGQLVE